MFEIKKDGVTVDRVDSQQDAWVSADAWCEFYPDSSVTIEKN